MTKEGLVGALVKSLRRGLCMGRNGVILDSGCFSVGLLQVSNQGLN